jgi:cellulose synthase/poly-beta-1,6-N-acetylglucosamine synthase-like glycosyltransferase
MLVPFILAYISWMFFPVLAEWLRFSFLNYPTQQLHASTLWVFLVRFFYTWYTFLAIGVAGAWAIAAFIAKNRQDGSNNKRFPSVSLIVPAYNEEGNVSRCVSSLFRCIEKYEGACEIIVVDDGSSDCTYEVAWSTLELGRKLHPNIRAKVIRHCANLGKVEAIRTGLKSALGSLIAVVDADSWWMPDTLSQLTDYMFTNDKKAVTGYVHPSDGDSELNPYVILQQLEYSQGLGINRCAQSLGSNVLVVSGAIGLYDADVLRGILSEKSISSVTEDLEITLEMHKQNKDVGYMSIAASSSVVPHSLNLLWTQRTRWFTGWFHNTLNIHRNLLTQKSWLTFLLWYCYIFEYGGAIVDFAAILAFPFLFWFASDGVLYLGNAIIFAAYGFLISITFQSIALKYAYNKHNYRDLLFYTPFYPILRLINILARLTSSIKFLFGYRGKWHS